MSIKRARGFTLIEMVIAIVIIGVALAGVLSVYQRGVASSADPLVHKQMLAVAEAMIEEILLLPMPADNGPGTIAGCNRANADSIADYNGYNQTGVCSVDGTAIAGLGNYTVTVNIANLNLNTVAGQQITVTVAKGGKSLVLSGFKAI